MLLFLRRSLITTAWALLSTGLLAVVPQTESTSPTTNTEWIVFDGVRNFSHAMVSCLVDHNIPCTVVVRSRDLMHADTRLPHSPLIKVVEADYASVQRPTVLDTIAVGAKYLFLDPECDDFHAWHETVINITRNALALAKKHKLTLVYPARVYSFDNTQVISENSTFNPITAQGRTIAKIENMLKYASDHHQCRVIKMRVSYAFGPAVYDYLLSTSFKDIPQLGRLTWLFRTDRPHQFVYTYDVARLALELTKAPDSGHSLTVHFSGYTYDSVEAFGHAICGVAGTTLKQRIVGKFLLSFICLSEPNAQRGSDLSAYFDLPVLLEDSAHITEVLKFQPTPPEVAIAKTMEWFKNHPETRSIFKKQPD